MSDIPRDHPTSSPLAPPTPAPTSPPAATTAPLPPPPAFAQPAPPSPVALSTRPKLRPGQLPIAWQIMMAIAGTAAFFAFAAVWKTSVEIGIGTWWLGPSSQPQPMIVRIVPFVITIVVSACAIYNVRRSALISAACAVALGVVASFDISRSGGLAAIEFAIAGSLLLISIGAQTGTIRATPAA